MVQHVVNKELPPVNHREIEHLSYAVRNIAAVVGLIEIAATDGDRQVVGFARGIQKTAELAGQRLEEISASLLEMATGEMQS